MSSSRRQPWQGAFLATAQRDHAAGGACYQGVRVAASRDLARHLGRDAESRTFLQAARLAGHLYVEVAVEDDPDLLSVDLVLGALLARLHRDVPHGQLRRAQ